MGIEPPDGRGISDLLAVMAALRDPQHGCPWDREQTFATIAPYTVEEATEVAEAIAQDDLEALRDELGDLLFQVVYHARMAEERGAFTFGDVVAGIVDKMVRRHPHVFGDLDVADAAELTGLWERLKAEERKGEAPAGAAAGDGREVPPRLLDEVPVALPGLSRAVKLQAKAAKVGFDWPTVQPVLAKVEEELAELGEALAADEPVERLREEFGDLVFVMANLARHLKFDPEQALREANAKFYRRFAFMEDRLDELGRKPTDLTLDELDALWDAAKATEAGDGRDSI